MPPGHEYPVASATPQPPAPPKHGWVHNHPYLATAVAAGALFILVGAVVAERSGVASSTGANNWVGASGIFSGGARTAPSSERISALETLRNRAPDTALPYIPLPAQNDGGSTENFGNLNELLSLLTTPPSGGTTGVDASASFAVLPQGLVSLSSPPKLSAEQQVLYQYGNDVGNIIQSYDSMHTNSIQILKDQAEDRGNAQKAAAVKQLGYDMALLGRDLLDMGSIPPSMKSAHDAFATSYRIAGTNLSKIPDAADDKAFVDAITTYNASIEALSKRYIVLVQLFSSNNVTFSSSDPGSIFMFNSSPSF